MQSLQTQQCRTRHFPAILGNTYIQQQKAELAQLQRQRRSCLKSSATGTRTSQGAAGISIAQTKLEGEVAKVVQSIHNEYLASLAKENSLIGALNQQKAVAQAMNRKAIDYGVLERDVQSSKQIYESLLQRAKETGVSTELRTSNIRVVDHAEQPEPGVTAEVAEPLALAHSVGPVLALAWRSSSSISTAGSNHPTKSALTWTAVARDGARAQPEDSGKAATR